MKSIRSSWNLDRVAACAVNRPRKVSAQKKVVEMYTAIRGNSVAVKTYRRAVRNSCVATAHILIVAASDFECRPLKWADVSPFGDWHGLCYMYWVRKFMEQSNESL